MPPIHHHEDHPQQRQPSSQRRHKLNPDPIRSSANSKQLAGCGPHRSYRYLHHQRGTVGTFRVRLLEGRKLSRKHWSALSLGPVKHLGLSRAHGELSSYGTLRLAFWKAGGGGGGDGDVADEDGKMSAKSRRSSDYATSATAASASASSESSVASNSAHSHPGSAAGQHPSFVPSMPMTPNQPTINDSNFDSSGKSPLAPLFDQGCIRSFSPARSPFLQSRAAYQQNPEEKFHGDSQQSISHSGSDSDWDSKPSSSSSPVIGPRKSTSSMPLPPSLSTQNNSPNNFGPSPPHHYAKDAFKTSTVQNDSNPIWGDDAHSFLDSKHNSNHERNENDNRSTFCIPLQKDDLLPALHADGGKVGLEIRLDEEMTGAESLLVGGALSTAVGAATAATSVIGMRRQTQNVGNMGMEMLGLGTDRLIGRGYVDLMPLLLGLWEESWEQNDGSAGEEKIADETLNEYGRISSRKMRRRMERMGMLDVWVPLYHPSATQTTNDGNEGDKTAETSGKVHLLISYEPNGMAPKRDDVVAFESFARRPISIGNNANNMGPVITPIVPPLSPLSVIDSKGSYLLLEYATSRTVTSVDRNGNVKSSKWERTHRVRIHRNSVFVVERHTLKDSIGSLARLPGDIVLSTPLGQELADATAPVVAGASELMGPALLWGKLMMATGSTGLRAGLAGARAATVAVVNASQEKALERRGEDGGGDDPGVYGYVG